MISKSVSQDGTLGPAFEPPHRQPVASVDAPIHESNMGHKMLSRMGWKEGTSLGANNRGIMTPVRPCILSFSREIDAWTFCLQLAPSVRMSREGLGTESATSSKAMGEDENAVRKRQQRHKTQQRYDNARVRSPICG